MVDWDVTHYSDRVSRKLANSGTQTAKKAEASLRKSYPPCMVAEIISKPSIIVDMHGTILAWCLPGMLKDSWQVSAFACPITRSNNMYFREK